ncbi:MAG: hypothetical protein VX824_05555, partial [Pseudomonadota bacterium]|nr:hypothetical protein [Pseudomonadota bacterium]
MREFRLQISNDEGKKISFGKRRPGETGRDILAVKEALGAIVQAADLPNQSENLNQIDPNGWLDCTTGEPLTLAQASKFDKSMEMRLMKFQLDHQFLIVCYLFHKFGVAKLINDAKRKMGSFGRNIATAIEGMDLDMSGGRSSPEQVKYEDLGRSGQEAFRKEIVKEVIDAMTNMFSGELGILDEATLAVMHGWLPQTRYGNESYYHLKDTGSSLPPDHPQWNDVVVDIIPVTLFDSFIKGEMTQKPGDPVSMEKIHAPDIDLPTAEFREPGQEIGILFPWRNNEVWLRHFTLNAPASY